MKKLGEIKLKEILETCMKAKDCFHCPFYKGESYEECAVFHIKENYDEKDLDKEYDIDDKLERKKDFDLMREKGDLL